MAELSAGRLTAHNLLPMQTRRLTDVFAVLRPDLKVDPVAVTPDLYTSLDRNYDAFHGHVLVALHDFDADWDTWECHPAGDEIVLLIAGSATLVIRDGDGEQSIDLATPGEYCIVPAGRWHTARVSEPVRMLFITPGAGTENREQPPDTGGR